MNKKTWCLRILQGGALLALTVALAQAGERIKDLGRFNGWRDNQLIGYGLVTGLAGSGDSARSQMTQQSMANLLKQFEVNLGPDQVNSRNAAAVMVTANMPPLLEPGARVDVTVTSVGDARSLLGGSLLQTPLKGGDGQVYVLAQGALSVGGYRYDSNGNRVQKNHPTVGLIPAGGIVEQAVATSFIRNGRVEFLLTAPDFTTAERIARAINQKLGRSLASPLGAGKVGIKVDSASAADATHLLSRIEAIEVTPDDRARVVVNERTGTVVAGGNVMLSAVTVVHGDLKISVETDYLVSQPPSLFGSARDVRTTVVPQTRVAVQEKPLPGISLKGNSTIADLVAALNRIQASPRDVIAVLQAVRTAGALRAELVIQ
ncbi:flagellar P-ring protein precursor FlgI [Chromobacterium alkanivorans]|uniref:flagellar basal body P-ring protein FlgI n=1 Tax=Chromobacterium alkanivorans TaxID=1071719 RepID=UPI001967655B|nr:flagellar basal body P-ring protein FlgI [Chromobacterium alkanivorans]MBN3005503.1 flagellar basal body P-ring protein FlgI [Chromobacterium alkanivorans]MCS3806406.1 flagellar P-ring protein precursor FlgI [Chromobacterium alkanivorans]MCS3820582.1 flagellar P-ring protein precursor FlgI [Chromobacterium alkanivorans]MCS3875340.1 flagellar P-ring protein precursor FlgI [Chromobacterium alkanivorans]